MNQILVDLQNNVVIPISTQNPNIVQKQLGGGTAVFEIDFQKFTTLSVVVEYKGKPAKWTLNIADKYTCDGYGGDGDGFGLGNCAEVQIIDQTMTVWSKGLVLAGGVVDPLIKKELALTNGAMKFVVKNQFVSWGQPYEELQTPNSKLLFAIPDLGNPKSDQYKVYVGLNRVIASAGATARTGTGVIRAIITLE